MFDRAKIAADSFNRTNSGVMNINISMIFIIGLFILIIVSIIIFNHLEKKSKFEIFKKRLERSGLSKKQKKIVFKYLEEKYHGYLLPFFLFEKIALKALKAADIENPEETYKKIKKIKL